MSRPVALAVGLSVLVGVGACSSGNQKGELEWVAALRPGDCVVAADRASAVNRMRVVPCRERHAMEVYARLPYPPIDPPAATASAGASSSTSSTTAAGSSPWKVATRSTPTTPPAAAASSSEYPGRDVLRSFAREGCAERFRAYLGSNPREPSYFLTYLFPSVASWSAASAQRPKLGPLTRLVTASTRSDRSVVCFVRTTGPALTASVRGPARPTSEPTAGVPTATARSTP